MKQPRIFFYFRLFFFSILLSFIVQTTYATVTVGTSGTIKRGTSFNVNWTVTNDSGCKGETDYLAEPTRGNWVKTLGTGGTISGTAMTANTYYFRCRSLLDPTGTYGTANLYVEDCGGSLSPGTTWNGSSCVASAPAPTVSGTCGTANARVYPNTETSWGSYSQCASGSPSDVTFPGVGSMVSWTCSGGPTCNAYRTLAQPGANSFSCNAEGTQATLSWGGVTGATRYPVRVDDPGAQDPFSGCGAAVHPNTAHTRALVPVALPR